MAIAYLLLAHKAPAQLERLFRALYHPEDIFILHIDRSAPTELHALAARLEAAHRKVRTLRSRRILWGGSAMAEVQIEAMGSALTQSGNWTHFVNLTGQDFPIKTRSEILACLLPERSYLTWFDPLADNRWVNARTRLTRYHLHWAWLTRVLGIPGMGRRLRACLGWTNQLPYAPCYTRKWPEFFDYFGGANHVVLALPAVRHLVDDPDARQIRRWLLAAGHSDEIVFQSVLLNSRLASTIINENWREIDFPPQSPHPRTFTLTDLPRLLASKALYARKFDFQVDSVVVDALEKHLRPKVEPHGTSAPP